MNLFGLGPAISDAIRLLSSGFYLCDRLCVFVGFLYRSALGDVYRVCLAVVLRSAIGSKVDYQPRFDKLFIFYTTRFKAKDSATVGADCWLPGSMPWFSA